MKTYIHVNQHIIRANKKHGEDNPMKMSLEGKSLKWVDWFNVRRTIKYPRLPRH